MKKVLLLSGRLLIGGVFVYAAWTKLRQHYLLFAMAIEAYKLVPESAAVVLARVLPWVELAVGVLLLSGILLRYAAAAASALLSIFFGLMVRSYAQGLQINCGCFGLGEALSPKTLVRDGALLALSLAVTVAVFRTARAPRSGRAAERDPRPQAAAE